MMKKWVFALLFFCGTLLAAEESGKLKSLQDYDSRLFLFDVQGFEPFNYQPFNPSEYQFVQDTGKTDAIGGIYFDPYRKQYFVFSRNFLQLNTNLFVQETIHAQTLMDLKEYAVGVVKGDFIIDFFRKNYPFLKLRIFNNYEELIFYAARGEIKVFAQNFPTAMLYLSKYSALQNFRQFRIFFPENTQENQVNLSELLHEKKQEALTPEKKNSGQPKVPSTPSTPTQTPEKQPEKNQEKIQITSSAKSVSLLFIFSALVTALLFLGVGGWFLSRFKKRKAGGWNELLVQGENRQVEFKSSLRWDYQAGQINPSLEYAVMRSLCAFLNSDGGILFVGVDDQGKILGLDPDYKVLFKKNKDGWLLKFSELVNDFLGKEIHQYLKSEITAKDDFEFAVIRVKPCKKPVFLKNKNREEFFIRTGAASQAMGIKETHEYIVSHWK